MTRATGTSMSGRVWSSTRKSRPSRLAMLTQAITCSRLSSAPNFELKSAWLGGSRVGRKRGWSGSRPRAGAVLVRGALVAHAHQTDGQKLIELGQRTQQRDPRIEVRTGTELDEIPATFLRLRHRDVTWDAEVMGDVEHPQPATGFGKLGLQLAHIGVVDGAEVEFAPLQWIVPPHRVRITPHQFTT